MAILRGARGDLELARPALTQLLLEKVREQIERTQHLVSLVPREKPPGARLPAKLGGGGCPAPAPG